MVTSPSADVAAALREVFLEDVVSFCFKAKEDSNTVGKLISPWSNQWSL